MYSRMSTGRGEAKNVEDEGGGSRHDKGIKESPGFEAFEGWVSMERPTCHASPLVTHQIRFAYWNDQAVHVTPSNEKE